MKLFSFWRSLATFRVCIALNPKGLKPDVVDIELVKGHQCKPEFQEINPQLLLPALVNGDGSIIFQSGRSGATAFLDHECRRTLQ
jgi:maleylacetoacetate isomerase/maleylpyruvate isomerase